MRLNLRPFENIRNGTQTIESRLFDEKRQQIKVGDDIELVARDNGENFVARVTALLVQPTFNELFSSQPPHLFGGETKQELLEAVFKYYSPEDEKNFGVVGIKLQLINPATN